MLGVPLAEHTLGISSDKGTTPYQNLHEKG